MKMRRTHHIVVFLALFLAAGAVVAAESAQQERKILAGSTAATGTARMYEQPQEAVVLVATATTLPDALTAEDRRMLNEITGYLKNSDTDRAMGSWKKLVRAISVKFRATSWFANRADAPKECGRSTLPVTVVIQ